MCVMWFWIGLFVCSLWLLIFSSDHFTFSAERLGVLFGLPQFVVGVTIVAVGTSLPELIASLFALWAGSPEIIFGNVVGSNIANILLILGVSAIVSSRVVAHESVFRVDLPILILATVCLIFFMWDGVFSRFEGVFSLVGASLYTWYLVSAHPQASDVDTPSDSSGVLNSFVVLFLSVAGVFIGARFTVMSVLELSVLLNLSSELIALSAVALGTSLPELSVAISAARKGNSSMIFGNVIGSNIFNSFIVVGIPSLFSSLSVPASLMRLSVPVMVVSTFVLVFLMRDHKLSRIEGFALTSAYLLFFFSVFL